MTNQLDFQQELLSKIKEGVIPSQLKKGQNTSTKPNKPTESQTKSPETKKTSATNETTNTQPTNHQQPLFTTPQLLIITGSLLLVVYLLTK